MKTAAKFVEEKSSVKGYLGNLTLAVAVEIQREGYNAGIIECAKIVDLANIPAMKKVQILNYFQSLQMPL